MLMTITVLLITWRSMSGPAKIFYEHFDELWMQYKLPFMATLFLLPLVNVRYCQIEQSLCRSHDSTAACLARNGQRRTVSLDSLFTTALAIIGAKSPTEFNAVADCAMMEKKIAKLEAELQAQPRFRRK